MAQQTTRATTRLPHQRRRRVSYVLMMVTAMAFAYFAGQVSADQPRMQAALDALNIAENQLSKATSDKGGHRVEALRLVRKAQTEVKKGIRYDRRH